MGRRRSPMSVGHRLQGGGPRLSGGVPGALCDAVSEVGPGVGGVRPWPFPGGVAGILAGSCLGGMPARHVCDRSSGCLALRGLLRSPVILLRCCPALRLSWFPAAMSCRRHCSAGSPCSRLPCLPGTFYASAPEGGQGNRKGIGKRRGLWGRRAGWDVDERGMASV